MSEVELQVARVLGAAVTRLREAGAQPEALAEYVAPRRVMLVRRPATMLPIGEAWRLGALLLESTTGAGTIPALWAAGHATRAATRQHPGNQSVSREERRDIAAAALRGGFAEGAPVNFDAVGIPLDEPSLQGLGADCPVGLVGDELRVRWRAGASLDDAPSLEAYLGERIGLLILGPNLA